MGRALCFGDFSASRLRGAHLITPHCSGLESACRCRLTTGFSPASLAKKKQLPEAQVLEFDSTMFEANVAMRLLVLRYDIGRLTQGQSAAPEISASH